MIIYVDDIIITRSNIERTNYLISLLGKQFSLNDLGKLHYLLGIGVIYHHDGLLLN